MATRWVRELSISYKLPLLLGASVAAIVVIASAPAWLRMRELVRVGEYELSRTLVQAWLEEHPDADGTRPRRVIAGATIRAIPIDEIDARDERATEAFEALPPPSADRAVDTVMLERWEGLGRRYLYAERRPAPDGEPTLIVLERVSENAGVQLGVNSLYVFGAGFVVLGVALVAFYLISSRLVLRPLRSLRLWAEAVRDGNTDERVDITTGDEFGQLAETCNLMLNALREREVRLRAINTSLDGKLNQLAEANATLDEASRLKGEFIANMSHELRTPLNAIIGFGDLLLDVARQETSELPEGENPPPILERRTRYLEHIVSAARGLLHLIESMLELAKIEAGRVRVAVEPADLGELCRGAAMMMEPQARKRRVGIELDLRVSPRVETDPRKVQQILLNLLSNAVKYAAPGEDEDRGDGEVIIRLESLVAEPAAVRLSVIDNGSGIPPEDQERIFQKFEQLDASETRSHGGAGLGLAISRELAAMLQGELQLVSHMGLGSMFSLILPVSYDHDRPAMQPGEQRFEGAVSRG